MEKYLEAGKIVNTHGIDGRVKAECWCDSLSVLAAQKTLYLRTKEGYRELTVEKASPFKQWVLLKFKGFDDPESANILREKIIYADRESVPLAEGAMFIADMIGLDVKNADTGKIYGKLKDVIFGVGSDIYEVDTGHGTALIPAVPEFIKKTSPETGILVSPIEGMFDEI